MQKPGLQQRLNGIRHFLRVTALAAVLVLSAAFACYRTSSDIQYAQGYGYVIRLSCNFNCHGAYPEMYLTFDTYDEALAWLDRWNREDRKNYAQGVKRQVYSGHPEYRRITGLLQPVPVPYVPATPDLNEPHPFVPE